MKTRIKNLLVAVLALAMLATGITGTDIHAKAAGGPIKVTEDTQHIVKPGETSHIKLSIVATDLYVSNPAITISAGDTAPFTFSNISMHLGLTEVDDVASGVPTDLEFDVKVSESARIGEYPIVINFAYTDLFNQSDKTATVSTTFNIIEEKTPAQLTIGNVALGDSSIGGNTNLSFRIFNEGEITAKNAYFTMDLGDSIEKRYTMTNIKIGDLAAGMTKDISLPITLLSTAAAGRKTLVVNFTYKTSEGTELKSTYNISVNLTAVTNEVKTPKISIEDITYGNSLKPGDNFNVSVALKNIGKAEARSIIVKVDDASVNGTDIIKNYFTEGIPVDNLEADAQGSVKIPLSVSKYTTTGGLKGVKIIVTYTDKDGTAYTVNDFVYVDVKVVTVETGKPNLVISNVTQNPAKPVAGEKVEVSFDLENKSNVDVTELKLAIPGLTEATFIPVNSDPYQYIEKLKGGDKIRVTIPLMISKLIPAGLNNITLNMTFDGGSADPATIPVKNVQNETVTVSKPKLIVSKYTTDVEELRAGKTFNFTFDIYNTNETVTAKNITVTVNQPDNIFTPTQGSNSFFINKMGPGETVSNTLEMKVKSDASTKAYTIEIQIEYEYDGAEPNPTTGEIGEKRTEKLNLQAVENSRPVINNPNVYSWEGMVTVGNPATMSFEFYNMGRSPLNNVIVYVEGDFTKSDGNMYFVGNAAEGSSTYAEFDVIPNVVGTAKGILRVTFEDSNGDTQEITQEFSTDVMDAGSMVMPGDMGDGTGEVFNPGASAAGKKAIVPIWAFVLIQCGIFIIFVPVTRKIIISAYKSRLRKKEQEQY